MMARVKIPNEILREYIRLRKLAFPEVIEAARDRHRKYKHSAKGRATRMRNRNSPTGRAGFRRRGLAWRALNIEKRKLANAKWSREHPGARNQNCANRR